MTARRPWVGLAVLGTSALLSCSLWNRAADEEASQPTPAELGKPLYAAYCADCHGPLGRGDGPRAATLVPPPANLTTIALRNGNTFRAETVAAFVDGRTYVEGHGPSAMPVWGREMDDRNRALDQELKLTPVWIAQIVAYLETIQERPK